MRPTKIAGVVIALLVTLVVVVSLARVKDAPNDRNDVLASGVADAENRDDGATREHAKPASRPSPAGLEISAAAKQNLYAFVTFVRKNDDASNRMQSIIKANQGDLSDRARFVSVDVDDPAQEEVISRYGADRSPIPLTLAIAPNGAITAGFPNKLDKADLSEAFASDGMASALKALQNGKLAAVCLQNSRTKNNKKIAATAEELRNAPELGGFIEIVRIDSSDPAESKFMKTCGISSDSADARILLLAPPGNMIGVFDGSATKDTIMATLTSALSSGCGSGGCGPTGCGP